ncbi:MAG: hypothetical protein ACJAX3_002594, partial [Patiriisocius sp.]
RFIFILVKIKKRLFYFDILTTQICEQINEKKNV